MLSRRKSSLAPMLCLLTVGMVFAGSSKAKSKGSIELISLTPEAGSSVDRESVITAQLQYKIDNFRNKRNRYTISIKFQKRDSRAAVFSIDPGDVVMLEEASGTVNLAYPLNHIWDNPELRKPLVIYFFLHERTGRRKSVVLDSTGEIHLSVRDLDPPA